MNISSYRHFTLSFSKISATHKDHTVILGCRPTLFFLVALTFWAQWETWICCLQTENKQIPEKCSSYVTPQSRCQSSYLNHTDNLKIYLNIFLNKDLSLFWKYLVVFLKRVPLPRIYILTRKGRDLHYITVVTVYSLFWSSAWPVQVQVQNHQATQKESNISPQPGLIQNRWVGMFKNAKNLGEFDLETRRNW